VNRKWCPSGRNQGNRCACSDSEGSSLVRGSAAVPASAETRHRLLLRPGAKIMTPVLPHEPPRPSTAAASGTGGPPAAPIFFNLLFAKNPINRLSGDQKGLFAPSVPASTRGVTESKSRTQSRSTPLVVATSARCCPSGETAGILSLPNVPPAGGNTDIPRT